MNRQESGSWRVVQWLLLGSLVGVAVLASFGAGFGLSALLGRQGLWSAPSATTAEPADVAPAPQEAADSDEEAFQLFWEVWDILQQSYYGELPDLDEVTYGAIQGMLETLDDPYTYFVEPHVAAVLNEDIGGSFEGVGVYVNMREDGKLEIVGVIPGSPAAEVDLQAGDLILAADGQSIVGFGIYEAIALIRGPAGTPVTLLVEREERPEPFEVTVVRARVEIPLVEGEMLADGVAYIRLVEFDATATVHMEAMLEELLAQEPVGIVLDLRGNPGGLVAQAVDVADIFLDDGVVLIERSANGRERVYRTRDGGMVEDIPLVVLVDGYTASAAEIVAGAIQARERGVLIGEPTFGKGSVQLPYQLTDGSGLWVTVARWYTPDDVQIHGQGLTPDVTVALATEGVEDGVDPQVERAVEYLLSGE